MAAPTNIPPAAHGQFQFSCAIYAVVKLCLALIYSSHHRQTLTHAIINKRVRWHEYHVPTPLTNASAAGSAATHLAWCAQGLSSPATIPNLFGVKPCTQIRQAKAPDLIFTK